MAYIGLAHVVAAPITNDAASEAPTYGEGFKVSELIGADISTEFNNEKLYADNIVAESDKSFKGGKITLEVNDFDLKVKADLCGGTYTPPGTGESATPAKYESNIDDEPKEHGLGYIKTRKRNGKTSYVAKWFKRTKFAPPGESAKTKGETIAWETEKSEGEIFPCMDGSWKEEAEFTKSDEAIAWVDEKANIKKVGA